MAGRVDDGLCIFANHQALLPTRPGTLSVCPGPGAGISYLTVGRAPDGSVSRASQDREFKALGGLSKSGGPSLPRLTPFSRWLSRNSDGTKAAAWPGPRPRLAIRRVIGRHQIRVIDALRGSWCCPRGKSRPKDLLE